MTISAEDSPTQNADAPVRPAPGMLARLRELTGVDFHVAVTLLFRTWSILAGGLMIVFIPLWLTPVQQGYYYTFASLIGLQVFFELGINQVIVQIVGHEMVHIVVRSDGRLEGEPLHIERMTSLVRMLKRWYLVAALGFVVVVSLSGLYFFGKRDALPGTTWVGAWVLLVACSAVNLYFSPALAVREGCGQMGQVARLRLVQSMLGYGLFWLALSAGAGLWAVPIVSGIAAICTLVWTRARASSPVAHFEASGDVVGHRISWRREVFPFQWRIALSWISGYFMLQLFTPVTFAHQGAVEAGKIGIAMSIFSALVTVGLSWVNTKTPLFTRLISRGERRELNRVFVHASTRSLTFTAVAILVLLAAVALLSIYFPKLTDRVAGMPVLACLGLATIANAAVFAAAAYMRAHREEPMLWQSIGVGLCVVGVVYATADLGATTMMAGYCAVMVGISLPWTAVLFRKYYRRTT